jgi:hypothetical protein
MSTSSSPQNKAEISQKEIHPNDHSTNEKSPNTGKIDISNVDAVQPFVPISQRVLDGEDLKRNLVEVLENIFSREYLATDPYLVSHMNKDFFVPISIIQEIPYVKSLTKNIDVIIDAIRSSGKIIFDEPSQTAKPTDPITVRNTLILRDIPPDTQTKEIQDLFGNTFSDKITEIKPEIGNMYFIKFVDEKSTLEAFTFIRQQTLNGHAISARIKSETILRSTYYPSPVVEQQDVYRYSNWQSNSGYAGTYKGDVFGGRGPKGRGRGQKGYRGQKERKSGNRRGRNANKRAGQNQSSGRNNSKNNPKDHTVPSEPSHWPALPSRNDKKNLVQYNRANVVSIINDIKEISPPVWEAKNAVFSDIVRKNYNPDLEILKDVDQSVNEIEWSIRSKKRTKSSGNDSKKNVTSNASKKTEKPKGKENVTTEKKNEEEKKRSDQEEKSNEKHHGDTEKPDISSENVSDNDNNHVGHNTNLATQ